MKHFLSKILLTAAAFSALMVSAQAMDYNFSTTAPQDFYKSGSYEDVYGSQYNYGGKTWWTSRSPSWSTADSVPPRPA